MALYTQFQDPAQYYLQKEERRDEGLRNAMAMMMQMKMQQREWARQNRIDELSERRVSAYEKSVADQNAEGQKQWQARWAAIDSMYPPGSRENMALKAGMSLDQIESNFYPESTIDTLTGWAGMTRQEWDQLSPSMKKQYFGKYYAEQNSDTISAYRQARDRRSDDIQLASIALRALDDMGQTASAKFKNYVSMGGDNPLAEILENIEKARAEVYDFQRNAAMGDITINDKYRNKISLYSNPSIMKDPYWWISPERREAYKKREGITSKNNLGPKSGELFSVTPTEEGGGKDLYGLIAAATSPEVKTVTKAKTIEIARAMGKSLDQVEAIPTDGGYLVALGGQKYLIPK